MIDGEAEFTGAMELRRRRTEMVAAASRILSAHIFNFI